MAACRHSPDASGWAGSGLPTSTLEEGGGGECPGSFWNTGLHHPVVPAGAAAGRQAPSAKDGL